MKPGEKLGPYELVSPIGKGGMGEVWRAYDPRLNRKVAIKISAQQFTGRFEREAHAIAALNHPNVCTLFDVGPNYLVMELIEGPTLAERIAEGPIPLEEALGIAQQIANGLEAAHEKAIVHRDLKPANVKIRPDGSVKVLDFGLARSGEEVEVTSDSPTMMPGTQVGMILGTAGYMSPEQARGQRADKRADIWAFGVVLYEMVTAKRLFDGSTVSDSLAAILMREPDLTLAPLEIRRLLERCLEKDPKKRLRDISGMEFLVGSEASSAPSHASTPKGDAGSRLSRTGGWILAGLLMLGLVTVGFLHFRERPAETPVLRLSINPPEKGRFPGVNGAPPVVSPDGRQIVFAAVSAEGRDQLWLRPLDALTARPLAGTENASGPFWSPDSKSIGFFAGGKLQRMDITGGAATPLADASDGRGGTWNQNGVIVFVPTPFGGLQAVPASGGAVRTVIPADPHDPRRFPSFLPDGKHVLYLAGTGTNLRERKIGIGSLDSPKDEKILSDGVDSFALYAQGRLLFLRGNTLVARPFDTKSLAFTGDGVPVAEQVQVGNNPNGLAKFSVSANGVLVYRSGLSDLRLTWLDRGGKRAGTLGDAGSLLGTVQFSPDRKTAAVTALEASGGNVDIWLYDVLRGLRTRFTFDPSIDASPVWSPDGRTIVFRSSRAGPGDLYRKPADGSRNEDLLYADKLTKSPGSISADGRYLAYMAQDPKTGQDIWILPDLLGTPGASKPYPFVQTEFNEFDPQFSPDGHWIAYYSNESGRNEVYATPFPGPSGKRQVSTAGGTLARWRPDGKELFYVSADSRLMAAEVEAKGGAFEVGKVDALSGPLSGLGNYDVSVDGQRFLAILPPEGDSGEPLTVVQNWMAGLKK